MKAAVERRAKYFAISQENNYKKDTIDKNQKRAIKYAAEADQLITLKTFYAASKIQSLIRGVLTRILYKELQLENQAIRRIQRVIRGKLGRLRWMREYWISLSVVKSDYALEEIKTRSTLVRESAAKYGPLFHPWKEYFDPLTDSFWYLNTSNKLNTWKCPLVFQQELICSWEGFQEFGGMPSQGRCRCVFDSVMEYQEHKKSHKWFCPACDHKNNGAVFPRCALCDNKTGINGEDGEKALEKSVNTVRQKLSMFLTKEKAFKKDDGYVIKDRVVELAARKQDDDVWLSMMKTKTAFVSTTESTGERVKSSTMNSSGPASDAVSLPSIRNTMITGNSRAGSEDRANKSSKGLRTQPGLVPTLTEFSATIKKEKAIDYLILGKTNDFESYAESSMSALADITPTSSIVSKAEATEFRSMKSSPEKLTKILDPIKTGNIPADIFDAIIDTNYQSLSEQIAMGTVSFSAANSLADDQSLQPSNTSGLRSLTQANLGPECLLVCSKFIQGDCTSTLCPYAHPGTRDASLSSIEFTRLAGSVRKVPFVRICQEYNGRVTGCTNGSLCTKYHIYIKPSVQEIILKLYPIEQGTKTKAFLGGAEIEGHVKRGKFNGYACMTWTDGSVYMGDWCDDIRHGFGIFRSSDGTEFIGQWAHGKREGWGYYRNSLNEEYEGQWLNGKMEGVGALTSANGDVYQGSFRNHKYHGIGMFTKKNGDRYLGNLVDGEASGLGILALSTGEKYKGNFDKNSRHGLGVCAYPNGARYAGNWYRGQINGFGIYLSHEGEKYVGQWSASKKHGNGRYYFSNGDFYDGQFHKNKANGVGVYYHANGNVYSGEWNDDRRHGRGTYVFASGSRYTGYFDNNNIHGKGKFDFANGAFYRGQFNMNKKYGKGIYTWSTNNQFKGDFVDDKMCGFGEMVYFGGHRYMGHWSNNRKNGQGVFYYSKGHKYDGLWVDDIRQGKGKLSFYYDSAAEESYEGDWFNDQKHGVGKYLYRQDEGTVYEGDWVDGLRHGKGVIKYKDGSYYRGDFQKELMWGKGIYVGCDGSQYDGQWRKNMRHGIGTQIATDGSIYHGEFWANMKHGKGKMMYPDSTVYEGTWEGNCILGKGKFTKPVGEGPGGGPDKIKVRVFGY